MKKIICVLAICAAGPVLAGGPEWQPLFDGKTLDGWTGRTNNYVWKDGVLFCTQGSGKMVTEKEYSDFEMEFDVKLSKGANNGIGIRTTVGGDAAYDGMELQVLDDPAPEYEHLHDYQYNCSIYGVVPAKRGFQKPTGEWNHERIIAIGDHIKIELNGTVVTEAWLDKIDKTMDGKNHPGLHWPKGHIGLLGHTASLEFRELKIRDWSVPPPTPGTAENVPPAGFGALFTGKDLANWKGLVANPPARAKMTPEQLAAAQVKADENMKAHWRVENGEIVFDGKGQNLCTAKKFASFDLYVDAKIPPLGDSGIYLRGSPQVQIWDPDNAREVNNGAQMGSGALWNNQKSGNRPLVRADNPIGQWNTFLIRMNGEKVTVFLNGKLVLENIVMENYWEREKPIYPEDSIELQNHGGPLWFKNIYVRELPQ